MIETPADRLALLTGLGQPVEVGGVAGVGVFSSGFLPVDFNDSTIWAERLDLVVDDSLAADASRGTAVVISGRRYRVEQVQPDGMGLTTLVLINAQ